MKEKLKQILVNKTTVIILIGALGLILIGVSYIPEKEETVLQEDYLKTTEERLKNIIESVEGAGETKVMITLKNDGEKVYVQTYKSDNDKTENEVVIVSGKNGNEALTQKELAPEIKGVVIVCEGGDNLRVRSDIINLVGAALGVEINRICVCKLTE